jgi:hypothetical protein
MNTEATSHLDDERCADLVLGLLKDTDRRAAVEHAARCLDCAARLRSHVAAAVRAAADEPAASGAGLREPEAGRVVVLPRTARRGWLLLPAAAALVVVSLWLPRAGGPGRSGAGEWLPPPGEAVLARGEAPLDGHLAAGFAAYARRELAAVERELSAVQAEGGAEQARRLYLAHALLARGEHARALELLRSLDFRELPLGVSRAAAGLLARALRAGGAQAAADSLERRLRETPAWVPVRP